MADEEKDKKKEKEDEKDEKKDKKEEQDNETGAEETAEAPDEIETPEDLGSKLELPKIEVMDFHTFVVNTYGQEEADALGLTPETEETEEPAAGDLENMPAESDETQVAGPEETEAAPDASAEAPEAAAEGPVVGDAGAEQPQA